MEEAINAMMEEYVVRESNKIFDFWKLEEYFTPSDYPELFLTIREGNSDVPFDAYYNEYSTRRLPLNAYKSHNVYLRQKKKPKSKLYDRANIYCGCYKIKTFVEKMVESCGLDIEKYEEVNELSGRFYIFSVQIELNGEITDEGVQVSPFFYAVHHMIKAKTVTADVKQEDICKLNEDINEILKQNATKILEFTDMNIIKRILFDKLKISSEQEVGLESATKRIYACKGLKKEDESSDFNSFYLDEIEMVQKNCKNNDQVIRYVTTLLMSNQNKIMIDSDVKAMTKWLDVDRFPMAKYPSKYSPTLMQQVAINIAISEKERKENIFSVNGPPGTGKTTLLKEIIASNVEQMAEVLIKYGVNNTKITPKKIESASNYSYTEKYYEIPEDIAKYGILVVSNNNGAVENVTLDLPKASEVSKEKTRTEHFDRSDVDEVYFSAVADKLLGRKGSAWGLISARMGRKSYVTEVLESCIFSRKNDEPDKVTLDSAKADSIPWEEAVYKYRNAKRKVLLLREEIKNDQKLLIDYYEQSKVLSEVKTELTTLTIKKSQVTEKLDAVKNELENNEKETSEIEEEIKYIKNHVSFLKRLTIFLGLGKLGKNIAEKQENIESLIMEHENIRRTYNDVEQNEEELNKKIDEQQVLLSEQERKVCDLWEKIYGDSCSLKEKYKNNLADREFFINIKEAEESQNSCPWTYGEYDRAREELFFAALQVRKAFVLESPYIKRNLFVYEAYNNGKYTIAEKKEMFPHLFNSLMIVIPVLSSTFASIGRLLKYAGEKSLGMLVIDESGQAVPQSALGALFRTKRAVVVGDPLQVEPVVTIPQVLIDILADSTGVANAYKVIENSVQIFADSMNEFNGKIGERQVGCPLVVHRRCIEPMFSISNMISYDNRMFNKTNKKEDYLKPEHPFLIKKSGWINVEGPEKGPKDHFVQNQAEKVCNLIENALPIYTELFETNDKIFIITPFRSVAESMRTYVIRYFGSKGYDKELLKNWTRNCIGTVHTFQGKDSNEVLFVLGCSSKSTGAMNWVVNKPNILNVACTRAKYRIAFIGNIKDWENRRFFRDFIPQLINLIDA